jgi:hypothetical protein
MSTTTKIDQRDKLKWKSWAGAPDRREREPVSQPADDGEIQAAKQLNLAT